MQELPFKYKERMNYAIQQFVSNGGMKAKSDWLKYLYNHIFKVLLAHGLTDFV